MKTLALILAGAAMALTGAAASAETRAEKSEASLAKMLGGRTAGEPVRCINTFGSHGLHVMDHIGLVYDAGRTIYVARTRNPDQLDSWDVPVIERFGSQLCSNDIMRTVDRSSGHITGALFLDDFVPYTKNG